MRLVQFKDRDGSRRVAASDDGRTLRVLDGIARTYDLALAAAREGVSLQALATRRIGSGTANFDEVIDEKRLLPPLDHADPYRCSDSRSWYLPQLARWCQPTHHRHLRRPPHGRDPNAGADHRFPQSLRVLT